MNNKTLIKGKYLQEPYSTPNHDPYYLKKKYQSPSQCKDCKVIFENGKFTFNAQAPQNPKLILCPACLRTKDKFIGGIVELKGKFIKDHQNEIINLIKNLEKNKMQIRPLERIIELKCEENHISISTTYEHLAKDIGSAMKKAYSGELEINYNKSEKLSHVNWQRD